MNYQRSSGRYCAISNGLTIDPRKTEFGNRRLKQLLIFLRVHLLMPSLKKSYQREQYGNDVPSFYTYGSKWKREREPSYIVNSL